jgi:hypothetical protein
MSSPDWEDAYAIKAGQYEPRNVSPPLHGAIRRCYGSVSSVREPSGHGACGRLVYPRPTPCV